MPKPRLPSTKTVANARTNASSNPNTISAPKSRIGWMSEMHTDANPAAEVRITALQVETVG